MKNKVISFLAALMVANIAFLSAFYVPVSAQAFSICTVIDPICTAILGPGYSLDGAGDKAQEFVLGRLNLVLSVIFVAIILIAVYIIIKSGVKYIQSQGDEGQIQEAQKAIKSVFVGIGVLFVGIIGILLVLAFFGGTGLIGSQDQQLGGDEKCTLTAGGRIDCGNLNPE